MDIVHEPYSSGSFCGGRPRRSPYHFFNAMLNTCVITAKDFCHIDSSPLPLTGICRRVIRQQIGKDRLVRIHELNLPKAIKIYLLYQD